MRVDALIRQAQKEGRDLSRIGPLVDKLNPLRQSERWKEAERIFDRILTELTATDLNTRSVQPEVLSRARGLIAISERDDAGREQIFLRNLPGGRRRQLTREKGAVRVFFPAWSPSGRKMAYVVGRRGTGPDIFVIDRSGSGRSLLAGGKGTQMTPAWSPNGRFIAYMHSSAAEDPTKIWIMNADGSGKRPLTDGASTDIAPTWSPDSTRIAFASDRDGGLFQIWVMDADGRNPRRLTEAFRDEALGREIEQKVPAWSPDGRYIAFWRGVERTGPTSARQLPWEIWIMNANDGSGQRRLARGDDPTWSPDSQTILHPGCRNPEATSPRQCGAIAGWVVRTDGRNRRLLFETNGNWGRPAWTRSR